MITIIKGRLKFIFISLIILLITLITNMYILQITTNADEFVNVTVKYYGQNINNITLNWGEDIPLIDAAEQTIQVSEENYRERPNVYTNGQKSLQYYIDRDTKTLYIFELDDVVIHISTNDLTQEDIENVSLQLEYTKYTSDERDGILGLIPIRFSQGPIGYKISGVEPLNDLLFGENKIGNINIPSKLTSESAYALTNLTSSNTYVVISQINRYLTDFNVYSSKENYDMEVEKLNDNEYVLKLKRKTPIVPDEDPNLSSDTTHLEKFTMSFYGEQAVPGTLAIENNGRRYEIHILAENIADNKVEVDIPTEYLDGAQISTEFTLDTAEAIRTYPETIISVPERKIHLSTGDALSVLVNYVNLTADDLKGTNLRVDYWKEKTKNYPKTIINPGIPTVQGDYILSARPVIKEAITRDPKPEYIVYTDTLTNILPESDVINGMKLTHYIKPELIETMPESVGFDIVPNGYKNYIISTNANRDKIDVEYNHNTRTLTLSKKKKVIPFKPLIPAKPINNGTPLIPLQPAEEIQPQPEPVQPQPKPVQPQQPPTNGGGGGGGNNETPKPQPQPQPTQPKPVQPVQPTPKKEEPKREVPTEPKKEEPKREEPKKEEPKREEPKREEPKYEEPKVEGPKRFEESKIEEPKRDTPDVPIFDEVTDIPVDDTPAPKVTVDYPKDKETDEHNVTKKNQPIKKSFDIDIREDEDIKIKSNPKYGKVEILQGNLQFKYTPNKDYLGNDSFEIEISKNDGSTQIHLVTIDIFDEDVPKAVPRLPKTGTNNTMLDIMAFWGTAVILIILSYLIISIRINAKAKELENLEK